MPAINNPVLRRRLFVETAIRRAPRARLPWYERLALTVSFAFIAAFVAGLVWHLLLFI